LVRKPEELGPAQILYSDIGDYLSKDQKLAILAENHDIYGSDIAWETIEPDESGDWINKGNSIFDDFIVLGDKKDKDNLKTFFIHKYSCGLKTNRDIWCYNFSNKSLINNIKTSISFYNSQVISFLDKKLTNNSLKAEDFITYDSKLFSWDWQQKLDINNNVSYKYNFNSVITSLYRPFQKQICYFNRQLNNRVYLLPSLFPTEAHKNCMYSRPLGRLL
jgi:predicted helicase